VRISGAPGNTVGGTEPAQSNVVSGNGGGGVEIVGSGATGNSVGRNLVGVGQGSPTSDLGNSAHGVRIEGGASDNIVGSVNANFTLPNTIVGNGGDGVFLGGGTGNRILTNAFGSNAGLGIDLSGGEESDLGVTANDEDDPDAGPNDLQNFPVLTSVVYDPSNGRTVYTGTLSSTPNQTFTIQFYGSDSADPSDHGEGDVFLGQLTVTTDDQGEASFSVGGPPSSEFATATATNTATGGTSEFSENVLRTYDQWEWRPRRENGRGWDPGSSD
jgi:hypothetical protein